MNGSDLTGFATWSKMVTTIGQVNTKSSLVVLCKALHHHWSNPSEIHLKSLPLVKMDELVAIVVECGE